MYGYLKKNKKKLKAITNLKCVIEEIQIISQMRAFFFYIYFEVTKHILRLLMNKKNLDWLRLPVPYKYSTHP